MDFRLELNIKPFKEKLRITDKLMLAGSCFTENIGEKLADHKFRVLTNPAGILFNPFSMLRLFQRMQQAVPFEQHEIFQHQEVWYSWDFHGRFSHTDAAQCLRQMNDAMDAASQWLQQTDWLILTLGSAFRYELKKNWPGAEAGTVVANCHKVPATEFEHRLATLPETAECLHQLLALIKSIRPACKVIFTISPVRHYREGLVENNCSKGTLHLAIRQVLPQWENAFYFPAYELVIDDLRDYRFYAEDLVHPNYAATHYVWQKFMDTVLCPADRELLDEIAEIRRAYRHRPSHPDTQAHRRFMEKYAAKTAALAANYPALDFTEELNYFNDTGGLLK